MIISDYQFLKISTDSEQLYSVWLNLKGVCGNTVISCHLHSKLRKILVHSYTSLNFYN